jgi:hypothetical protein
MIAAGILALVLAIAIRIERHREALSDVYFWSGTVALVALGTALLVGARRLHRS